MTVVFHVLLSGDVIVSKMFVPHDQRMVLFHSLKWKIIWWIFSRKSSIFDDYPRFDVMENVDGSVVLNGCQVTEMLGLFCCNLTLLYSWLVSWTSCQELFALILWIRDTFFLICEHALRFQAWHWALGFFHSTFPTQELLLLVHNVLSAAALI